MANITNARQLGAVVRAARKKQGLSQESLAARAGVSRAWLARFETGHPASSIAPIFRVLRSLDLGLTVGERTITDAEAAVLAALARREER
ncbi:helix-turn-helix domain-containing protein [Nocardia sp. CA-290969]|uniref:helix-turn-helix domain-containing protein n=1 Tax=Nocardia sp. CA-290969 TaxID=3239986 RepID=UPI003D8F7B76